MSRCLGTSQIHRFVALAFDWFVYYGSRTIAGLPEVLTRTYERTSRVNMTCPGLSPQTLEGTLSDRSLLIRVPRELQSHPSMFSIRLLLIPDSATVIKR